MARSARTWLGAAIAIALVALLLPGVAGAASVRGDFDGDGFADLAVGVPGQDVAPGTSGSVHVIYGSRHGLSKRDAVIKIELPGTVEFGIALADGDFNGDGRSDLAVGAPFSTFGSQTGAGYVAVIYGTKHGLPLHRAQLIAQGDGGMPGTPEQFDDFGRALAAADFGKGEADDLAIGVPGEDDGAGEVDVLYGSPDGLRPKTGVAFSRASSPSLGTAAPNESLGWSLAAGNLGRGGGSDLAVGIPRAAASNLGQAGSAAVLFGGPKGITASGARLITADTPGLSSGAQADADFGWAVAIGNFGHSRLDDLAVGAPFAKDGANVGQVTVLYGGSSGPQTKHAQLLELGKHGLPAPAPGGDAFGRELAAGDAGSSARDDLISSSERDVDAVQSAGAIIAVYGSPGGLTGKGSQEIDRTTKGIAGQPTENDFFGTSMSIGPYGGRGSRWVAVGVPGADAGSTEAVGAVNLLRNGKHGLRGAGVLMEGAGGLSGAAQNSDLFGAELSGPSNVGLFD